MKKILSFFIFIFFSSFNLALANDCAEVKYEWQKMTTHSIDQIYEYGYVNPQKEYIKIDSDPNCGRPIYAINKWNVGEKSEALDYYHSMNEHFCVVRDNQGSFGLIKYKTSAGFLSYNDFDNIDNITQVISEYKKEKQSLENFGMKLGALASLGDIPEDYQYPNCD